MTPKTLAKIPEGLPEALLMICSSSALSCPMLAELTGDAFEHATLALREKNRHSLGFVSRNVACLPTPI
jgi:hypothetical protein